MSKLKDYDLIIGFNIGDAGVERSPKKVQDLKTELSSRYRASKSQTNNTVDVTCQHVWIEEYNDDHRLGRMGFEELLLVGFKTFGKHQDIDGEGDYSRYSFPVILLDDQVEGIKEQVRTTYELDNTPEMVYMAPRDQGHFF